MDGTITLPRTLFSSEHEQFRDQVHALDFAAELLAWLE